MAVAGQAALSYESARLLTSHMEKLKQDSEIAIAKNVQQALLPKSCPKFPATTSSPPTTRPWRWAATITTRCCWTTEASACRSATWRGRGFQPRW